MCLAPCIAANIVVSLLRCLEGFLRQIEDGQVWLPTFLDQSLRRPHRGACEKFTKGRQG